MIFGIDAALVVGLIFSFVFPLGLLVWWKCKTGAKLSCFLAGAVCFPLFAMVLEALLHQFCLRAENPVSEAINASPVLYMLYGAFAAGIFEETGRLFGFGVLLKKHREPECSVAYGIGHGGIEVILIMGLTYLVYTLSCLGVPIGNEETANQIVEVASSIPLSSVLVACIERISAMMLHIGLSMVVFTAVKEKGRFYRYLLAILLHALADMPAALAQTGVLSSILVVEVFAFLCGLIYLLYGSALIRRYGGKRERALRRRRRQRK